MFLIVYEEPVEETHITNKDIVRIKEDSLEIRIDNYFGVHTDNYEEAIKIVFDGNVISDLKISVI